MKKTGLIALIIALGLVIGGCLNVEINAENNVGMSEGEEKVHFIDVGQGDSILVESNGEYMLVDAGEEDKGDTVTDYLMQLGVESIKYAVATHPHSDHIGGMDDVINGFKVENIIMPDASNNTRSFENLLDAVENNNVNAIKAEPGSSFTLGDFKCDILGPLSVSDDMNNNSVVIKLVCGNDKILLTGDCSKSEENEILNSGADLSADLLKAGHHGSSTSSSEKFIKAVNPLAAVISCGKNNDYGHPHKEVVDLYTNMGIEMYRTDDLGTVVAECSGNGIKINGSSVADTLEENNKDNEIQTENVYILNTKSKKYHKTDCGSIKNIKNKEEYKGSADELKAMGYSPCGNCKPE